jgi:predicted MPP superfamily phosphohydrolase
VKTFRRLLPGLSVLLGGLLAWGLIEPYFIDTEEQVAEIPGLPTAWKGERVGVIADWQVGMWLDNTGTIERSVERLVAERPAAMLLAGDFVYGPSDDQDEDIEKIKEFARPLPEAGIPTYAVLGNHDYRMAWPEGDPNPQAAARVREALESVGAHVLKNEAAPLAGSLSDGVLPYRPPLSPQPLALAPRTTLA